MCITRVEEVDVEIAPEFITAVELACYGGIIHFSFCHTVLVYIPLSFYPQCCRVEYTSIHNLGLQLYTIDNAGIFEVARIHNGEYFLL